ncbi:OapC/ArvC family zinc-ribbon domain-containing protein [Halomarina ordinaria]|uniref:Zn-ribbon containing protein n=1 Tax=Halomarina ordinaria TaxID=3033939 RepID=A0ABD5UBQ7_9EURY|nr:Zn-ribbon containing protein [Halomarina sp. PSRA2]
MPHQCTECGHVFADGSKEMLSGCPECGGTKFQFHPKDAPIPETPPADAAPPDREDGGVAETVGRATTTVRGWVHGDTDPVTSSGTGTVDRERAQSDAGVDEAVDAPRSDVAAESDPSADPDREDAAQASARRDVASPDELPDPPEQDAPADGRVVREPTGERPDLSQLREELNEQFESIKILEPGQYELNLMELYDREEYIIALQENGRYVIQMPENWIGRDPDEDD